jgi:hypothetical protein
VVPSSIALRDPIFLKNLTVLFLNFSFKKSQNRTKKSFFEDSLRRGTMGWGAMPEDRAGLSGDHLAPTVDRNEIR